LLILAWCNPKKAYRELESGTISLEEINHQNEAGYSVLHMVAINATTIGEAFIQKLLDLGADVNAQLSDGGTPLILACCKTKTASTDQAVEILLKHPKIKVNAQTNNGAHALMLACSHSGENTTEKTVELLLQHPEIDINLADNDGDTALMMACQSYSTDNPNVLRMLLKMPKLDIFMKNKQGESAIDFCTKKYRTEIFELLLNSRR